MQTPTFLVNRGITQTATLDFETFYSQEYTLRRMSTSLYIFDPQFLVHGLGINLNGVTNYYNTDSAIRHALAQIDWSKTAILCHHTQFDALILFYHYGIIPVYYLDTLSMARPVLQNVLKKLDLDSIAKHFNVQGKLAGLEDTKGKRELSPRESARLGIYCKNDVDITMPVFDNLWPHFANCEMEMDIIHLTIRMYARPLMMVDEPLIDLEIHEIQKSKQIMFNRVQALFPSEYKTKDILKVLRSGDMFKNVIEYNGLESPRKISPRTGLETHAFARTDLDFQKMNTGEDIKNDLKKDAQLLYEARLASKSDTALNKALILKKFAMAGCCPAYLNYWKANTGRWTGGDKVQMQNLPREGAARSSLLAPYDCVLLVSDLSQVELRMSAWFAGQQDILDVFIDGKDVYKDMATKIYNVDYDKVTKDQRMVAKVTCLGLGYGCGVKTFEKMLLAGMMGPKVDLGYTEVSSIHTIYRQSNDKVVDTWKLAGKWLKSMITEGANKPVTYKGLTFRKEGVDMPNGTVMNYHNLHADENDDLTYNGPNGMTKRIYSSLFYENIIQSLARHVIAEQMVHVAEKYDVVLSVHDELIVSVPFEEIDEATIFVEGIMRTSPKWCHDLPLDCESGYDICYSK